MPRGLITHVAACDFNPNAGKRRKKKSGMGGRQPADPPQTTLNNNAHVSIRVKKKRGAKLKAVEVQHRSTGNTKNASSSAHATLLLKKSGSAFLTYR